MAKNAVPSLTPKFKGNNVVSIQFHQICRQVCSNMKNLFDRDCRKSGEKYQIIMEVRKEMLSRDCDGCGQMQICSRRYYIVEKGDKVYCPDGTAHLVDGK